SQIFPAKPLISRKLLPLAGVGSDRQGEVHEKLETKEFDPNLSNAFFLTDRLKDSHLSKAFSSIVSKFTHPSREPAPATWGASGRGRRQRCSWTLRVHSHSMGKLRDNTGEGFRQMRVF
ncbi:MAG: hypothetical protein AAFP24_12600, partial [Pseudomonadota bacterium]